MRFGQESSSIHAFPFENIVWEINLLSRQRINVRENQVDI